MSDINLTNRSVANFIVFQEPKYEESESEDDDSDVFSKTSDESE